MAVLGISSATKVISVGISDKGKILAELAISEKQAFTEDLILYIDEIIKQTKASLSAIAVASGPGSYSGLRGGLATAKSIAQALNVPIIEVSTLDAIAYNLIDITGTIFVTTDARKDEFNAALFACRTLSPFTRLTDDMLMKIEKILEFLSNIKGELYLCDLTQELYPALIAINPSTKIKPVAAQSTWPKGSNVALIGEKLLQEGKKSDIMKLAPKYSVEPNIREFKKG